MICQYCKKPAEWVENKEIYGRNYGKSYMAWLCRNCDAYVGCHQNTKKPLGTMANKELREWRMKAHAAFDPLWLGTFKRGSNKRLNREAWYNRISNSFGFRVHIAESDVETCKAIIQWCKSCQKKGKV